MDSNCKVIQDMLPLYVDDICSNESRQMVENHIQNCPECAEILTKLKNPAAIEVLIEEGDDVVKRHDRKVKRKSFTVGVVFAAILMIPVVICMIVNLAVGHGLSWFFIVLASLLVLASLTVVPLMAPRYKLLWTLGSFFGSLLLLFAVTCIMTGGRWFFVVAFSTLFGLAVVFMPVVAHFITAEPFSKHKGLIVIGTDLILYASMIVSIGLFTRTGGYWVIAGSISLIFIVFVVGILIFARYLPIRKTFRAALIVLWCGIFAATAENLTFMLMGYSVVWHPFKPLVWNFATIHTNGNWLVFIGCLITSVILMICGIASGKKENGND